MKEETNLTSNISSDIPSAPPPPNLTKKKVELIETKYEKNINPNLKAEETTLLVLHQNQEYIEETAKLLNTHWKMKLETRISTLEKSNDNFPINLILLGKESKTVIGKIFCN